MPYRKPGESSVEAWRHHPYDHLSKDQPRDSPSPYDGVVKPLKLAKLWNDVGHKGQCDVVIRLSDFVTIFFMFFVPLIGEFVLQVVAVESREGEGGKRFKRTSGSKCLFLILKSVTTSAVTTLIVGCARQAVGSFNLSF